jgi:hypothetical protein
MRSDASQRLNSVSDGTYSTVGWALHADVELLIAHHAGTGDGVHEGASEDERERASEEERKGDRERASAACGAVRQEGGRKG